MVCFVIAVVARTEARKCYQSTEGLFITRRPQSLASLWLCRTRPLGKKHVYSRN